MNKHTYSVTHTYAHSHIPDESTLQDVSSKHVLYQKNSVVDNVLVCQMGKVCMVPALGGLDYLHLLWAVSIIFNILTVSKS